MRHVFLLLVCSSFLQVNGQMKTIEVSHYVFPEFTPGYVLMKSGVKNPVYLNYNGLSEEMVYEENGQKMALAAPQLMSIDTIFIKNRKFVQKNGKFLELLLPHSDYTLFAEYKCSVAYPGRATGPGRTSQTSSSEQYSSLATLGVFYELKLPDGYKTKPYNYYWLKKGKELHKIKTLKQLTKHYGDKKGEFKAYIKDNNVSFKNPENITQVVAYMESL